MAKKARGRKAKKPARKAGQGIRKVRKGKGTRKAVRKVIPVTPRKTPVGRVVHYYTNIGVCVVELSDWLRAGDKISFQGATTNFSQKVESMQVNHVPVQQAKAGDSIGLKVKGRVREGDSVFRA